MKKKNGWLYAFWILLSVILILALAVGLISWAGSRNEDEVDEDNEAAVLSVSISGTLALAYGDETGTALTANVTMSDGSDYEGDYAWTSSDTEEKVVKVSGSGASVTVTPVFCGTAEITVSVGEGDNVETDTCTVTVSEDHTAAVAGRITEVQADDERLSAGVDLAFSATSITATYTPSTDSSDGMAGTYTIDGVSEAFTEDLAKAFWVTEDVNAHKDCQYITFELNAGAGETLAVTTYNGETEEKTYAMYGDGVEGTDTTDGVFVLDTTDHTEGAWRMEIEVAYAGGDVETYTVVLGDIERGVATAADIQEAVKESGDVALTEDIELSSSLTIGSDDDDEEVEVTLDLNGNDLSSNNTTTGQTNSTIIVKANATLTVTGEGTVDASADNTAALYNDGGTVILEGGTFERSEEEGTEEYGQASVNSYYTVENHGDMTIEDGAVVFNAGNYSTCLKNSSGTDTTIPATLTINGGKIYGGKYAVKNDYSGVLVMTGGTVGGLRSEDDALPYRALDNYDNATITGGMLLGGNGGAVSSDNLGKTDGLVAEGLVIYNNSGVDSHTDQNDKIERSDERGVLTIGDENGNGPEIIYEGVNAYAAEPIDNDVDETPKFATGIAIESGTVNFQGGAIKCSDTAAEKGYNFIGAYLTNGTLNVSGGKISGDEALEIDCAEDDGATVSATITGGTLSGTIIAYAVDVESAATNPLTFAGYADAGYTLTTVYSDAETVLAYKYTQSRVTATIEGDSRLGPFSSTEISVAYDEDTKTYTVSGTSIAFGDDVDDFWGAAADSHTDCEYIAFEISVWADETLRITTVDADGVTTKVFAMYGSNVAEEAKTLTDDDDEPLKEADGVWIVDVTKEDEHEGSSKMTIEVIGADGQVTETYYVVIGTITSSVAA